MRSKSIRNLTAVVAVLALTVAACGGGGGNGDQTTTTQGQSQGVEVTVNATEFAFEPSTIEVPAGVPVTIILVNDGVVEHDFSIDDIDLHIFANPGETVRETVTFTAGTYEVHCAVAGHKEAGMMGTLVAG